MRILRWFKRGSTGTPVAANVSTSLSAPKTASRPASPRKESSTSSTKTTTSAPVDRVERARAAMSDPSVVARLNKYIVPDEDGVLCWTGMMSKRGIPLIALKRNDGKYTPHDLRALIWRNTCGGYDGRRYMIDYPKDKPRCVDLRYLRLIPHQENGKWNQKGEVPFYQYHHPSVENPFVSLTPVVQSTEAVDAS